ncbi:DNA-binding transcriptional regulator, LysR family [Anaerosphaera aminiphila DSM 21120]|uniref:DNA-binding transcriptional regulator, LysR family n=1 Tax=Anaerosphaera aminiphila DSM 21120 TaxID=1120995 RepID=A0A1M5U7R4_9FIRM|nr:LysR family transcriptional regulator [Anaerosphaera aminiphila]SHH59027.1 DNA-binding transcriptional regulator, LysR family [Anaerosphaera aminiphila DSM 21120]
MELRYLEYFEAVSRLKSYTKASKELFVSQPTITIAIQKLEEEFGVKLIIRNNKELFLTKEGKLFLEYVRQILGIVQKTVDVMEDIKPNSKETLRLAFPVNLCSWLWAFIFNDFLINYPDVEIDIYDVGNSIVMELLKENKVELGFGMFNEYNKINIDLEVKKIFDGEMSLLMSSDSELNDLKTIPISALKGKKIIMYPKDTTYVEKIIKEEFDKKGIIPDIMYVKEQVTIYELVAQGYGISIISELGLDYIRNNPSLTSKPFEDPINFSVGILWGKNRYLSNTSRKFISFLDKIY